MVTEHNRRVIPEDGQEYCGYGFGAAENRVCEIVFNTSMVGYQEMSASSRCQPGRSKLPPL